MSAGITLGLSWSKRTHNLISLHVVVKQVQGKQQRRTMHQYNTFTLNQGLSLVGQRLMHHQSNSFLSYEKIQYVWLKLYNFNLCPFPLRGCSEISVSQYNSQKLKHLKKAHKWNTLTTKIHFFIGFDLP